MQVYKSIDFKKAFWQIVWKTFHTDLKFLRSHSKGLTQLYSNCPTGFCVIHLAPIHAAPLSIYNTFDFKASWEETRLCIFLKEESILQLQPHICQAYKVSSVVSARTDKYINPVSLIRKDIKQIALYWSTLHIWLRLMTSLWAGWQTKWQRVKKKKMETRSIMMADKMKLVWSILGPFRISNGEQNTFT